MYSFFLYGGLYKSSNVGFSVAKANAAKESIIRFTHRSWIVAIGVSHITTDPIKEIMIAKTLIDS